MSDKEKSEIEGYLDELFGMIDDYGEEELKNTKLQQILKLISTPTPSNRIKLIIDKIKEVLHNTDKVDNKKIILLNLLRLVYNQDYNKVLNEYNIPSDYKVLIVVDLQNCFIQGGSLGSINITDLKKYIELVKEVDKKISQNNYDLVVFSKDSHPLNHSSLSDNQNPLYGVYTYHCRNSKNNCTKDTQETTTYISSTAKDAIRDILCAGKTDSEKEHFYDVKESYEEDDYNFYNPKYKEEFTRLIKDADSEIRYVIDDQDYNIDDKKIKTLKNLIKGYIADTKLDKESKEYLEGINSKYFKLKVQGLDLNYLFYNTTTLKDIIYDLNNSSNSEIGITDEQHINKIPDYSDTKYNVDNITHITSSNTNNTKFITIAKGQYCYYESYSAFNYHIKINKQKSIIYDLFRRYDSSLNVLEKLPAEERYSTGLFEYILKDYHTQTSKQNINIDVCGLVTNICVINTVQQGIALWENVYKKRVGENIKCTFNLLEYLSIPLRINFDGLPYLNYKYDQQVNKETDLEKRRLQIDNLVTLFATKFQKDVIDPNIAIDSIIPYNVDYNIIQAGGNRYKYKHNKLIRNKVKKYDEVVHISAKIAAKKAHKKEILGKERCIYKMSGDRKEYLKHKGGLITVSEYKKLMKSKK